MILRSKMEMRKPAAHKRENVTGGLRSRVWGEGIKRGREDGESRGMEIEEEEGWRERARESESADVIKYLWLYVITDSDSFSLEAPHR